jgi:hypothetical protein
MKIIKLQDDTHTLLTKIKGELMALKGKSVTYDDAIKYLIEKSNTK